jgi:hypothetical protein
LVNDSSAGAVDWMKRAAAIEPHAICSMPPHLYCNATIKQTCAVYMSRIKSNQLGNISVAYDIGKQVTM